MRLRILLLLSFLSIAVTFLTAKNVFAQQTGFNVTLSPSLLDLTANPGDTLKEKFRIRNNGDTPMDVSITVDKLDPHSRNGQIVPVKPDPTDQSVSWISFDTATFSAQPKEWLEVPFTITIPKTAAFGYYYAFRIGPSKAGSSQNGATTQLLGQIVLPVLLNVTSPHANANLQLLSFTTTNFLSEYLPVSFQATFTNTGNVAVRPSGTIFIRLKDGQSEALDMNSQAGIILPGGKRTFSVDWTDGFLVQQPVMEDGQVKLDANNHPMYTLQINWNYLTHFRIGKYTATLLAVYDNGQKDVPFEASTTFWVLPWKLLGGIVLGFVALLVLAKLWLDWYIKQQLKRQQ